MSSPQRAVVVTGATGFIGRHVVAELLTHGFHVRALVRRAGSGLPEQVETAVVPALDAADARAPLARAMAGAIAVVHLAGRAHLTRDDAADPIHDFRVAHVRSTAALLDAMGGSGPMRLVALSTVAAAVSATLSPVGDDVDPAPATSYGVSKREMEELIARRAPAEGVGAVVLRPPLVYGPGMRGNPDRLFRLVMAGGPIPLPMPPARRSVLYVGNLAQAIRLALTADRLDDRPYFVADGPAPTTEAFARAMGAAAGRPARILPVPRPMLRAAAAAGDLLARVVPFPFTTYEAARLTGSVELDPARFWRDLDAVPRHDLPDGMARTAAWYRAAASR